MAITKNLVEMMGGIITVNSKKGVGTEFVVVVPLKESERREDEAALQEALKDERITSLLSGKKILIAEDVDQNAEILANILEIEAIETQHAKNGAEAVRMFEESEKGTYSAILMDVRMPVMDGLDATRNIRASVHPDAKKIPIIAMTANVFDEDAERSLAAGMNAHLSKPVEPEVLYETMARLIMELMAEEE